MLSPTLRAAAGRRIALARSQRPRYASHEAPQYNEPTGWFLGEKVFVSAHGGNTPD
jgi:hypothetical protein